MEDLFSVQDFFVLKTFLNSTGSLFYHSLYKNLNIIEFLPDEYNFDFSKHYVFLFLGVDLINCATVFLSYLRNIKTSFFVLWRSTIPNFFDSIKLNNSKSFFVNFLKGKV